MKILKLLISFFLFSMIFSTVSAELRLRPERIFYCEPTLGESIILGNNQICEMPWGAVKLERYATCDGPYVLVFLSYFEYVEVCQGGTCGRGVKRVPFLDGTAFSPIPRYDAFRGEYVTVKFTMKDMGRKLKIVFEITEVYPGWIVFQLIGYDTLE